MATAGILLPTIIALTLIASSFLIACNSNANHSTKKTNAELITEKNSGNEIKNDTSASGAAHLKKIVINEQYFLTRTGKTRMLTPQEIANLQVDKVIDTPGLIDAPGNGFRLLDTVFTHAETKLYILAHSTENESRAWLIQYNAQQGFTFSVLVYYADLVEYFFTITSIIKEDTITIVRKNDMEDDQSVVTTIFNFTGDFHIREKK